jgi:hypothetical protein
VNSESSHSGSQQGGHRPSVSITPGPLASVSSKVLGARLRVFVLRASRDPSLLRVPDASVATALRLPSLDALLAALAGILSLALYVRTLVPWVLPGDSGEFQVLAAELGIAHTTGYPIYMLLAHIFDVLVPVGDLAYRANLFSAVMGALTIAGVYLAGRLLTGRRAAALFGALALAVGFTFWSQALIAEVYTAGAFFLVAVLVWLLAWYRSGARRLLFMAGMTGGLGLGAHNSVGLLAPPIVVFLLLNWRRLQYSSTESSLRRPAPVISVPPWFSALAGGLAGLLLYGMAFLAVDLHAPPANIFNAAYGPSRSNWGLSQAAIDSPLSRIWFVASAGQWRGAFFINPAEDTPARLDQYIAKLPREFSGLALALALVGLLYLLWRDRRLATLFVLALAVQCFVYFNYQVGDIYVFYIPSYLLLSLLAATGLTALADGIEAAVRALAGGTTKTTASPAPRQDGNGQAGGDGPSPQASPRGKRLAVVLGICLSVLQLALLVLAVQPVLAPYWRSVRVGEVPFLGYRDYLVNRDTRYFGSLAARRVQALPADAIVFTDWNWLWPYYYAAHLEAGRYGMQFIETTPASEHRGLASSVVDFVAAQIATRPIYTSDRVFELQQARFTLQPESIAGADYFRVVP